MGDLRIERFTTDDLEFGRQLTDAEGWGRSDADWKRLMRIEPEGTFKAVVDGTRVGVAGATSYGRVAWIHSVIVREEWRGGGIGRELMGRCIDHVLARGAGCIKLDSVSGQEGFYEKSGFAIEFESLRYVGDGKRGHVAAERASESDLPEICEFDRDMCGLDRSRVLTEIFRDNPQLSFLKRSKGELNGFIMARPGEARIEIGPCVTLPGSEDVWSDLIRSVMAHAPDAKLRICVPGRIVAVGPSLARLGFAKVAAPTRMYKGDLFVESDACIGMISPEKG